MHHNKWILALPIMSFIWFTCTVILGGLFYPEFSHTSRFISELGATGSPYGDYVNYLGIIPAELMMLAFVFVSHHKLPSTKMNVIGLIFITLYSLCLGVAALFPCDFECRPITPTFSQTLHMLSAFVGYMCGIISIFILSLTSSRWTQKSTFKFVSLILAFICLYLVFSLSDQSTFVGLYQRSLDATIYLWFIYFAYYLSQYLADKPKNVSGDIRRLSRN